jgi:hypothetical protein
VGYIPSKLYKEITGKICKSTRKHINYRLLKRLF